MSSPKEHPEHYFEDELNFYLKVAQVLGIRMYQTNAWRKTIFTVTYCTLVVLVHIGVTCFLIYTAWERAYYYNSWMNFIIDFSWYAFGVALIVQAAYQDYTRGKKLKNIIAHINWIDEELYVQGVNANQLSHTTFRPVMIRQMFLMVILIFDIFHTNLDLNDITDTVLVYTQILYLLVIYIPFVILTNALLKRQRMLTTLANKLNSDSKQLEQDTQIVEKITVLEFELHYVSELLNEQFGQCLLSNVLYMFLNTLASSYNITKIIMENTIMDDIAYFINTIGTQIVITMDLMWILSVCERNTKEIENFTRALFSAVISDKTQTFASNSVVKNFLTLHPKIIFSASNYFVLNHELATALVGIICSMTTLMAQLQ